MYSISIADNCMLIYRNRKFYWSVRYVGLVAGYWTVAFSAKFFMILFGQSLFQVDQDTNKEVFQACMISMTDFFSVVVPMFLVSDTYFIKVFSGKQFKTEGIIDINDDRDTALLGTLADTNFLSNEKTQQGDTSEQKYSPVEARASMASESRPSLHSRGLNFVIETPYLKEDS